MGFFAFLLEKGQKYKPFEVLIYAGYAPQKYLPLIVATC